MDSRKKLRIGAMAGCPAGGSLRIVWAVLPWVVLACSSRVDDAPRVSGELIAAWLGGAESAFAGLAHLTGLALFLAIVTRRFRFIFLTPLVGASQTQFNEFVKKIATSNLPDGMLTDSVYDASSQRWQTWESRVEPYVEPKPFKFYEVIVPTTDSTKFSYLLRELGPRKPVLFVGASGTAKTTIIMDYLEGLSDDTSRKLTIGFSSRTSSMDVQKNLEVNVDKRTGAISAF